MHGVALTVRRPARHQEAAQAFRRLRQHQEGVAHGRRHEPLMAIEAERAITRRLGAGDVGAQVRAALVLGHAHADERGTLFPDRAKAAVVAAAIDFRQPRRGDLRRLPQGRHRAIGHGERATDPAFDLHEQVEPGRARHVRTRFRLRPRARMQAGAQRDRQQFMPGRMEFDLIDAVTVAVEGTQGRRILVGVEAELDGLRLAQRRAERLQPVFRPARLLARDRLAQHRVAGEQVIGLERRRLVGDLEHRLLPVIPGRVSARTRNDESYATRQFTETARPAPAPWSRDSP